MNNSNDLKVRHGCGLFLSCVGLVLFIQGGNSEIVHKPAVEDDPHRRRPDISIAKKHIGWEPKVSIQDAAALPLVHSSLKKSYNLLFLKKYEKWQMTWKKSDEPKQDPNANKQLNFL